MHKLVYLGGTVAPDAKNMENAVVFRKEDQRQGESEFAPELAKRALNPFALKKMPIYHVCGNSSRLQNRPNRADHRPGTLPRRDGKEIAPIIDDEIKLIPQSGHGCVRVLMLQ